MALAYDERKAPLGPVEREELVQAVIAAPHNESEPEWLEWKVPADPLPKWIPRIAWYIGGFGNRPVAWAQRSVEGFGFLLLGAEPGRVSGVAPMDTADLIKGVAAYLGPSGPRWDPHFIDINRATVLLIGVAPPRDGDPVHVIRKNYGGTIDGKTWRYGDGDTPIRVGSETRKATAAEHDMLVARAKGGKPKLDITVVNASGPLRAIDATDEARDEWLADVQAKLMSSAPAAIPPSLGGLGVGAMNMMQTVLGEARTPEKYRQLVGKYLDECRETWFNRLARLAARHRLSELYIDVVNNTEENFRDVEVTLRIAGAVAAEWPVEWDDLTLPKVPKPYGSQGMLASLDDMVMPHHLTMPTGLTPVNSTASIKRTGDKLVITYDAFDLRPGNTEELETVVLLIGPRHAGETLGAVWRATSKSVSGSAFGEVALPIEPEAVSPIELTGRPEPKATYGERGELDIEDEAG